MAAESWEFEEAIECFRIIDSSLRCIYNGEMHMYRVLSTQLRILLCDAPKPLLNRLFSNLELQRLHPVNVYEQGKFPTELNHLNSIDISYGKNLAVSCMPFEAKIYFNGVEDCIPILDTSGILLPIDQWIEQTISLHPVPLTIRKIIRTVADRGGGAHVHKSEDTLLTSVKHISPSKLNLAALIMIAISKIIRTLGFQIIQLYEKHGVNGCLPIDCFDKNHPSILSSARIPDECLKHPHTAFNLLSIGQKT